MAYDSTVDPRIEKVQKLLLVAGTLEQLKPVQYDQTVFRYESEDCGTVCCALGWAAHAHGKELGLKFYGSAPVLATYDHREEPFPNSVAAAQAVFGITEREAIELFSGLGSTHRDYAVEHGVWDDPDGEKLTPDIVAASLRHFVETKVASIIKENV